MSSSLTQQDSAADQAMREKMREKRLERVAFRYGSTIQGKKAHQRPSEDGICISKDCTCVGQPEGGEGTKNCVDLKLEFEEDATPCLCPIVNGTDFCACCLLRIKI